MTRFIRLHYLAVRLTAVQKKRKNPKMSEPKTPPDTAEQSVPDKRSTATRTVGQGGTGQTDKKFHKLNGWGFRLNGVGMGGKAPKSGK